MRITTAIEVHGQSGNEARVVYRWDGSETAAAIVGGHAFMLGYQRRNPFEWPVKLIEDPTVDRRMYGGPRYIAVRTDHYPLMWVLYWLWLRVQAVAIADSDCLLIWAWLLGLIDAPAYEPLSWKYLVFWPKVQHGE
jgi:hypothetical protein